MAISKVIGSTTYSVPTQGQRGWGSDVTNLLARLADVANQVVTAQYTLTTDNFFRDSSGQFGIKSNFLKGVGAIASSDGFIRMASPHANPGQGELFPSGTPEGRSYTYLSWRNSTNSGDLHLFPNTDNNTLQFAGHTLVDTDSSQLIQFKNIDGTNQVSGNALVDLSVFNNKIAPNAEIEWTKLQFRAPDLVAITGGAGQLTTSTVTTTELEYLTGVTSNIQTQLNGKIGAVTPITPGTATKVTYNAQGLITAGTTLLAADIPTGISAANIGAGAVDSTEFGYLGGVTSAIQTQINNKQATGNYLTALTGDVVAAGPGSAVATIQANAVTTAKILDANVTTAKLADLAVTTLKLAASSVTDAKVAAGIDAAKIGAGTVSNTVFGYLAGVTSAIQTQLDAKIPAAILTAKGDLLTRNSTVNTNLAVGTNGQYLKADSTTATGLAWADIVAGGSGEKNYIGNPNSSTNWVASNAAQMTIATEAVQANLPDNATQLTGLRFTRISGTAYVYYRFTLDAVDYNKKLKIVKDMKFAGAANDYRVEVYSNTASNYTGTSTQLTVSPTGNLPGLYTGQVSMTFDSSGTAAPYIEVRIVGVAGTTPLYINNFLVGPGVLGQVPAVGPLALYTPVWTAATTPPVRGTIAFEKAVPYRNVSVLELDYELRQTAAGTAGSGTYYMSLPAGLSIDSTLVDIGQLHELGSGYAFNGTTEYNVKVFAQSTTLLRFSLFTAATTTTSMSNGNASFGNATLNFSFQARIPIAEWAGSGTVNMGAAAQVEYAYNTSTSTTTSDTGSFGSGAQGALIQPITAALNRRVQFSTPIQSSDLLAFQVSSDRVQWFTVDNRIDFPSGAAPTPYANQNTASYGMGRRLMVSGSTTQVDIGFGQYSSENPTTFGGAGSNYSSAGSLYWRVAKFSASSPVGFGLATATDSGLVSGGKVPGTTSGSATAVGYIGEIITSTDSALRTIGAMNTGVFTSVTGLSISLTAGEWLISFNCTAQSILGTGGGAEIYSMARVRNTTDSTTLVQTAGGYVLASTVPVNAVSGHAASKPILITGTKTFTVDIGWTVNGGTPSSVNTFARNDWATGHLTAVRIG